MSDEHELIAGIAARDPEAFRTLMERHAAPVINLAFRFLGTVADAEDAAQDVFLRLYESPPHLNSSTKLSTWLYRVTVNRCLDLLRKKPRRGQTVSLESSASDDSEEEMSLQEKLPDISTATPREQVAQAEQSSSVRQAVAALPELLRIPLILATFEELSQEEIARILKVSPKAVEHRIARARELLKTRLSPHL